ncbi:hypothetical protein MFIFM68171_00369 [Madurella fahalii]|uniref:Yeast cell wall synthesis Kre9/Knh1-like N-terminal domain-containing protein n=1 Tax=Madurella fahalii TaxID=1157608 RepID=A0ABQ0FXC9_9PEZI
MQFTLATVLALANAALAQVAGFHAITQPAEGEQVPAGSTYEIVWQPNADYPGTIVIGLLGGATPATLSVVDTIAAGVDGSTGSYSWTVDEALGDLDTYGIMITLEDDVSVFQYGFPFQIIPSADDSDDEDDDTSSSSSSSSSSAITTASETETETETVTRTGSGSSEATATVTPTISSSTIRGNLSTTSTASRSTITTVVTQQPPSTTSSSTTSIATNGVASVAAGSFALLGGVAMAVLAL